MSWAGPSGYQAPLSDPEVLNLPRRRRLPRLDEALTSKGRTPEYGAATGFAHLLGKRTAIPMLPAAAITITGTSALTARASP